MNEAEILNRLDERGRRAAASLRQATPDLPQVPADPAYVRPPASRPSVRVLVAAAVVGFLVTGALALALRDDGRKDTDPAVKTESPRKFAPEWLPPVDLGVTYSFSDVELGDMEAFPSRAGIWGPASTGEGFEGPSLMTTLFAPGLDTSNGPWRPSGEIEVNGRPAGYRDDKQLPGMHSVEFEIEPDRWAMVSSRDLDRDTLVALAASSEVDGNAVTLSAAALPDGWQRLYEDDAALFRGRGVPGPGQSFVAYAGTDQAESIGVAVGPGDERRVEAMRAALDDVGTVEVRGHRAVTGRMRRVDVDVDVETEKLSPIDVLMWEERPGEVVRISGDGIGGADLQRVAESLHEITADEYAAFGAASRVAGYEYLPTVTAGAAPGGTRWQLEARIVDELDLEVEEPVVEEHSGGPLPGSVSPPDESATEVPSPDSEDGPTFYLDFSMEGESGYFISRPLAEVGPGSLSVSGASVQIWNPKTSTSTLMAYGLVPSDAVRVELRAADGWVGEAELYAIADERLGLSAFIGEVPEGTTAVEAIPFRADGERMSSVSIYFEGG